MASAKVSGREKGIRRAAMAARRAGWNAFEHRETQPQQSKGRGDTGFSPGAAAAAATLPGKPLPPLRRWHWEGPTHSIARLIRPIWTNFARLRGLAHLAHSPRLSAASPSFPSDQRARGVDPERASWEAAREVGVSQPTGRRWGEGDGRVWENSDRNNGPKL